MRKLLILLTLFICLFANNSRASHIVGGEIYYDSLGNNQYRITIELFRDCSSFTDFDQPLDYTIFYTNGTIWSQFSMQYILKEQLPIIYDDPCVTPPSDICIERAIYVDTVILPFDIDGYYISYQRCCWAANIDNIVDPANNGITLTTSIPGSSLVDIHNQGARFANYPPLVLCSGQSFDFDHHATDPDGDSLVYALADPYLGGSSGNVTPNPESAAPYSPVGWEPTYSTFQPFGAGSTIAVDPQTGIITFTPNLIGNYVAGVKVDEYREGVLINTHTRTYGYRIVACTVTEPIEVSVSGATSIIEDCGFAGFIIHRPDSTDELTVQVLLSGTAVNGDDYPFIEDTLTIPANVGTDTIGISAFYDAIAEGNETVQLNIIIENICDGTFDTTSIAINIIDYTALTISVPDSINICADNGEVTWLSTVVENGVPPYGYYWQFGGWPDSDSILVTGMVLEPNLNNFVVSAADVCGKTIQSPIIRVYNQCPLSTPNFITMNGDGTNDAFIVQHLEDFDKVELTVVNRWGITVFHSDDYQNDWKGLDASGNQLTSGVYFYTVTPSSEKYEYDDAKETIFTIHGFVHILGGK